MDGTNHRHTREKKVRMTRSGMIGLHVLADPVESLPSSACAVSPVSGSPSVLGFDSASDSGFGSLVGSGSGFSSGTGSGAT